MLSDAIVYAGVVTHIKVDNLEKGRQNIQFVVQSGTNTILCYYESRKGDPILFRIREGNRILVCGFYLYQDYRCHIQIVFRSIWSASDGDLERFHHPSSIKELVESFEKSANLVPWYWDDWFSKIKDEAPYNLPHYEEGGVYINYFENLEDFLQGQSSRIKPDHYLKRFTAFFEERIDNEVQVFHENLDNLTFHLVPPASFQASEKELEYLRSEWARVYKEGPYSCMKEWGHLTAPYVYPGNGVGLAYLTNSSGQIVARSIVMPRTREYIRSFGVSEYCRRYLISLLKEQEYKKGDLEGVILALIPSPQGFLIPDVDGKCNRATLCFEEGTMLICPDGEYILDYDVNDGYLAPWGKCINCQKLFDLYDQINDVHNGETWCTGCFEKEFCLAYDGPFSRNYHYKKSCVLIENVWYLNNSELLKEFGISENDDGTYHRVS